MFDTIQPFQEGPIGANFSPTINPSQTLFDTIQPFQEGLIGANFSPIINPSQTLFDTIQPFQEELIGAKFSLIMNPSQTLFDAIQSKDSASLFQILLTHQWLTDARLPHHREVPSDIPFIHALWLGWTKGAKIILEFESKALIDPLIAPLHQMVKFNQKKMINWLLRSPKMDINMMNYNNRTAIQTAAREGKVEIFGHLLKLGAKTFDLPSVSHVRLIEDIPKPSHRIDFGYSRSLIEDAIHGKSAAILERLLQEATRLKVPLPFLFEMKSGRAWRPMHEVASYGLYEMVEILFRYGCSLDTIDARKCSPLIRAVGHTEFTTNVTDRDRSETVRRIIYLKMQDMYRRLERFSVSKRYRKDRRRSSIVVDILPFLQYSNSNDDAPWGTDALYFAVNTGNAETLITLLQLGAQPCHQPDRHGSLFIHRVARYVAFNAQHQECIDIIKAVSEYPIPSPPIMYDGQARPYNLTEEQILAIRYRIYFQPSLTFQLLFNLF